MSLREAVPRLEVGSFRRNGDSPPLPLTFRSKWTGQSMQRLIAFVLVAKHVTFDCDGRSGRLRRETMAESKLSSM